jgi:hypothetical protein
MTVATLTKKLSSLPTSWLVFSFGQRNARAVGGVASAYKADIGSAHASPEKSRKGKNVGMGAAL